MGIENQSVVDYLEKNSDELYAYFLECRSDEKLPNYSEFCRKYLNGETREGISFNSIKVKRRELTDFIRVKYRLWLEIN